MSVLAATSRGTALRSAKEKTGASTSITAASLATLSPLGWPLTHPATCNGKRGNNLLTV